MSGGYSARVRDYLVETATVAPRATAVVRQTTTWEEFPRLWGQLLDEVYGYVRPRPELATWDTPGERWHRGNYAALGEADDAVHRFAAERGLELAGPRWEIYGHARDDPAKAETEVYYVLGRR